MFECLIAMTCDEKKIFFFTKRWCKWEIACIFRNNFLIQCFCNQFFRLDFLNDLFFSKKFLTWLFCSKYFFRQLSVLIQCLSVSMLLSMMLIVDVWCELFLSIQLEDEICNCFENRCFWSRKKNVQRLVFLVLVFVFERTWMIWKGFENFAVSKPSQRYDIIIEAIKTHTFLSIEILLVERKKGVWLRLFLNKNCL